MRDDIEQFIPKLKESSNIMFRERPFRKKIESTLKHIKDDEWIYYIAGANVTFNPTGDIKPSSFKLKGKKPVILAITSRRFLLHYRIFPNNELEQIPIEDIRSVDMHKDMFSSKVRVSSLRKVVDIDSSVKEKAYKLIIDAFDLAMKHQKGSATNIVNISESKEDAVKALRELATLKDDGIITEEEFQRKKAELLSKI